MKRIILLVAMLVAAHGTVVRAGGIGVGVFGGRSNPVLQGDIGSGTLFGVRAPVRLLPLFTVEPYFASTNLADKVTTVAGLSYTRQGFSERAWGVNAMFTTGGKLSFFPYAGAGRASLQRSGYDRSLMNYDLGIGLGFSPVPRLNLDVRVELQAVVEGQATRKFANATAGISYSLLSLP